MNAKDIYFRVRNPHSFTYALSYLQQGMDLQINTFSEGEKGIRECIQWLALHPVPSTLGLIDGNEYDHHAAMLINVFQDSLISEGYEHEPLPENAPKASVVRNLGNGISMLEGGSNRAKDSYMEKQRIAAAEKEKFNSTASCKSALASEFSKDYYFANPKNWKRINKHTHNGIVSRVYECAGCVVTVIFDPSEDKSPLRVIKKNLFPKVDKSILRELKAAANKIKHIGDYGILHINPTTFEVVWCCADGDGDEPCTSLEDIETMLRVKGISKVSVEAEWEPSLSDGFISLGKFGKVVNCEY